MNYDFEYFIDLLDRYNVTTIAEAKEVMMIAKMERGK